MRYKTHVLFAFFLVIAGIYPSAALSWLTSSTSEEKQPITCGDNLVTGMRCTGGYCDNIRLRCSSQRFDTGNRRWQNWTWDGNFIPSARCGYNQVITGVACKDSWCGKISIECTTLREYRVLTNDCEPSGTISEEGSGRIGFTADYYAVAVSCQGLWCDDKEFRICKIEER